MVSQKIPLIVGNCCAGIPQLLADASGGTHVGFSNHEHPFEYVGGKREIVLPGIKNHYVLSHYSNIIVFNKLIDRFDVLQFHSNSMLPKGLDFMLWRYKHKEIQTYFHGSDIRNNYILKPRRGADRTFVSTPDLLTHLPYAEWVPQPIRIPAILPPLPKNESQPLRILHAPSSVKKKGTDFIRTVVTSLIETGIPLDYREVSGTSNAEIFIHMQWADVVIDQITQIGCYGKTSVEAMLQGRPVICSIKEDYQSYYRKCPVISALPGSPEMLTSALISLYEDPAWRQQLGRAGQHYVKKTHNVNIIVKQLFGE